MKAFLLFCAVIMALLAAPFFTGVFSKGTPYEAQIQSFVYGSVAAFVRGEFAGRSRLNRPTYSTHPVCKPEDYQRLLADYGNDEAFDKFEGSCLIVEFTEDWRYVHGFARIPPNYCETIKSAYNHMLVTQVRSYFTQEYRDIIISYRGAYYRTSREDLARSAKLKTSCLDDGSFYIRAERMKLWGIF